MCIRDSYNIDDFIDSDSSDVIVKGNIIEIEYVYIDGCSYYVLTVDVERAYKGEVQETITVYEDGGCLLYTSRCV